MPESREDRRHSSNPSEGETTPSEPPLGLKNPLLPASTLGQKFLSPKFLSPMGAQPLTTVNSLTRSRKEMSEASPLDNSFEGSPFLGDSRSLLASEPVTVQTSLATPGSVATRASSSDLTVVQPFSETEFSEVQAFSESESPQPSSAAVSEFTAAAPPMTVQTKAISGASDIEPSSGAFESVGHSPTPEIPSLVQAFSETESPTLSTSTVSAVTEATQPVVQTKTISEANVVEASSGTPESVAESLTPKIPTVVQAFSETESPTLSPAAVPGVTELTQQAVQTKTISEASATPTSLTSTQSNSPETTPEQPPGIQAFSEEAPPAKSISTATIAAQPSVIQSFSQKAPTQSSSAQTPLTQAPGIQAFSEEAPAQSKSAESLQAEPSVVQAFSEEVVTQSSSAETPLAQPPGIKAFSEQAPAQAISAQTPLTQAPGIQAFSEEAPYAVSAVNEAIATPNQLASTPSNTAEPLPAQQPGVQTFSELASTQSNSAQITPAQPQVLASTQSNSAQITPAQPQVVQAFSEAITTESSSTPDWSASEPPVQAFSEDTSTQQSSAEITLAQQPGVQTFSEDAQTQPSLLETTSAHPQVVQAFSGDAPTQPVSAETTPARPPGVQTFSGDAPTQPSSAETTPAQPPGVQAFSEEAPSAASVVNKAPATPTPLASTPSSSAEITPAQPPLVQTFLEEAPAQPSSAETTPAQPPGVQAFSEEAPSAASAVNEALATPTPLASTQLSWAEITPAQPPLVQTFSQEAPAQSSSAETTPAQPPTVQAFSKAVTTESSATPIASVSEPVVQAFSEDAPTQPDAAEITPAQQPVVQAFSKAVTTESSGISPSPALEPVVPAFFDAAPDSSVAESVTSAESTVVQAFSETEALPQLPRVLENLSTLKPLGSSRPLAQQSYFPLGASSAESDSGLSTSIQRMPVETTPAQEPVVQPFSKPATNEPATGLGAIAQRPQRGIAAPSEPVPVESVGEGTTSTESTLVQAFSETEALPEVPTVLENLATLKPLGSSRPLAQQSDFLASAFSSESSGGQPTNLQRMPEAASGYSSDASFPMSSLPTGQVTPVTPDREPFTLRRFAPSASGGKTPEPNQLTRPLASSARTRGIPSSWSSVAELLDETTADSTSAFGMETPIQRASAYSREEDPFERREQGNLGTTIQEYSSSSGSISLFSGNPVANSASTPSGEQALVSEEISLGDNPSKEKDSKNLEILAREIYSFIRQRLEIERERRGY